MSEHTISFELPKNVDHYLATLSKLYAQDGKRQLQELIVNAKTRVHEGWSADNWNGGTYGHALYLDVPQKLFLNVVDAKDDIQIQIKTDLNKVHNIQNEFIEEVFLGMEISEDHDWREDSGLLLEGFRVVAPDATKRIWSGSGFRVFLSHKSEVKVETAKLRDQLKIFGISAFVAHEDILPTQAWQEEIENALASMDAFVAVMTTNFHESDWTDQEVGYAVARGVPIIAAKLGRDPYGFIGKFQALRTSWLTCAEDVAKILIRNDRMLVEYFLALKNCKTWDMGNAQSKMLDSIASLTGDQADGLIKIYNENSELRGSFGFNGTKTFGYGPGLVHYLNRFGTRKFQYGSSWLIESV